MRAKLKAWWENYLRLPEAIDVQKAQRIRNFLGVATLSLLAMSLSLLQAIFVYFNWNWIIAQVAGIMIFGTLIVFARRGKMWPSYVFLIVVLALIMWLRLDTTSFMILAYALPVVMAPLVVESWLSLPMSVLSVGSIYWVDYLANYHTEFDFLILNLIFMLFGGMAWFASSSLERALRSVARTADDLQDLNEDLEVERALLAQRTTELERRARDMQASADISREVASELALDELLIRVVRLVSQGFDAYHVAIFLLDDMREWLILQAASSLTGQQRLAQEYRVNVADADNTVSVVVKQGLAQILTAASSIQARDMFDLPQTRSSITLPLQAQGTVIGALDVHSTTTNAFLKDDISVLQSLADQIALAINNARLFEQLERSIEAQRKLYGDLSRDAWRDLLQTRQDFAYRSTEQGVSQLTHVVDVFSPNSVAGQAFAEGELLEGESQSDGRVPLAIPVRSSSGDVIGVIDTYKPVLAGTWTPDEKALLREVTERLGSALESARFYDDIQKRAAREQMTRELTDEMRSSIDMETILRTAVASLGRAIGAPRTYVRLLPQRTDENVDDAQLVVGGSYDQNEPETG